jgi:hypothetical protein
VQDPSRRPDPRTRYLVLYLVGVAGLAAAITLLFLGMRAVMDVGGMCAEGGAYVIQQHCPEGAALTTLLGFLGGFASLVLAGWMGASIGGGAGSVVLLAWPAAFGVLGFNFLQYGLDPPGDQPGWAWGWLFTGVVFEIMALGPLLIGVWLARVGGGATAAATRRIPGGARLGTALRDTRGARDARRSAAGPVALGTDREDAGSAAPEDAPGEDLVGGLERLADLHRAGSLSDDEYARAKAELLERAGA